MRIIEVVDYQPEWPQQFEAEAVAIGKALGRCLIRSHHIGSTAVPGMAAKPIIDILLEVRDLNELDGFNAAMAKLGYEAMGEFGIERRRFFKKGGDQRTHHVHAYLTDDKHVARHLAFRDYVVAHPKVQKEYTLLKKELAKTFFDRSEQYSLAKNEFVQHHERQALVWAGENQPERL